MGTNYYFHENPKPACECCGREYEPTTLHVGKSSGGWCFSLHVIPEFGLNSLDDWMAYLKDRVETGKGVIQNEYGEEANLDELWAIIALRRWGDGTFDDRRFMMGGWYESEEDFHAKNHSERGPNGLLRHQIDGVHCIGHGEGTWDLIPGEFS